MKLSKVLDPFPFFRLAIPLVAGIFLSYLFPELWAGWSIYGGVGIGLLLGMLFTFRIQTYASRWMFGALLYTFIFILGHGLYQYRVQQVTVEWEKHPMVYRGFVIDEPELKQKSVSCRIRTSGKDIYLYLHQDSTAKTVEMGDELLFYTRIQQPKNAGNPYEFDYASYLFRQGISGTAFVYADRWQKTGRKVPLNWKQRAVQLRHQLLDYYADWHFEEQASAVLSALTVGYKEGLSEELKEQYASAGISHVLALSGMHVGILWGILGLLLYPLNNYRTGRVFRWLILNLTLWGYAFLAGLSASIVRAVIMCLFVELGNVRRSRSCSLNLLAVAAFAMLLYNPLYLFDVGFQLSFIAVFSIVVCFRPFYQWISPQNFVTKFLVATLGVSLAAQIGVAPLVIYYFSNFPTYFLLSNLIVSPLVCIIMYLSICSLCLFFLPSVQTLIVTLLEYSIRFLNSFALWVHELPGASVDGLYLTVFEVIALYVFTMMFLGYMKTKHPRFVLLGLLVMTCFMGELCYRSFPHQTHPILWFYRVRNHFAIHCINPDRTSYLFTSDSTLNAIKYLEKSYWKREKLQKPVLLTDTLTRTDIWTKGGIIKWRDKKVCVISSNEWTRRETRQKLDIDYMYIAKGYTGNIQTLLNFFQCKKIVFDGSLSDYRIEKLTSECKARGIEYIDLDEKGSWQILL